MNVAEKNLIEAERQAWLQNAPLIQPEDAYINLPPCDVEGTLELLRFLREEDDAAEQRETFQYLKRVLDEDRFSDRKIFP